MSEADVATIRAEIRAMNAHLNRIDETLNKVNQELRDNAVTRQKMLDALKRLNELIDSQERRIHDLEERVGAHDDQLKAIKTSGGIFFSVIAAGSFLLLILSWIWKK